MASTQYYRTAEECQVKCHDKSLGQKVTDMAGRVLTGNHASHGHKAHYQDQTIKKTDCYSQSQTYYPDHSNVNKQYCHSVGNSNGHNGLGHSLAHGHNGIGHGDAHGHNGMGHSLAHGHNGSGHGNAHGHNGIGHSLAHGHSGHHAASGGMICHEKNKKKSEHKKEKCFRNKRKDGNKSCSDSSSSDSD